MRRSRGRLIAVPPFRTRCEEHQISRSEHGISAAIGPRWDVLLGAVGPRHRSTLHYYAALHEWVGFLEIAIQRYPWPIDALEPWAQVFD